MPTREQFTEDYLLEYVKRQLGYPTVNVELTTMQVKDCIEEVVELFNRYLPLTETQGQTLNKGKYVVSQPDSNLGVLDVEFLRRDRLDEYSVESALIYDPFYFISSGSLGGMDPAFYTASRMWLESVGRVFGAEFDYESNDEGVFLYLPAEANVKIVWAMPYTSLEDIKPEYHSLFKKLTLAKSKQILGEIRRKYAGVPAASGVVQMNGAELVNEGKAEEDRFTDDLIRVSTHYIPSFG